MLLISIYEKFSWYWTMKSNSKLFYERLKYEKSFRINFQYFNIKLGPDHFTSRDCPLYLCQLRLTRMSHVSKEEILFGFQYIKGMFSLPLSRKTRRHKRFNKRHWNRNLLEWNKIFWIVWAQACHPDVISVMAWQEHLFILIKNLC